MVSEIRLIKPDSEMNLVVLGTHGKYRIVLKCGADLPGPVCRVDKRFPAHLKNELSVDCKHLQVPSRLPEKSVQCFHKGLISIQSQRLLGRSNLYATISFEISLNFSDSYVLMMGAGGPGSGNNGWQDALHSGKMPECRKVEKAGS